MEKSLTLLQSLQQAFNCTEIDIKTYSPLTLAYIGDGIYDVIIRTIVVERGNRAANGLHKTTSSFVNAGTQSAMIEAVASELTEEEMAVYKRGRNAKSYTMAKNATVVDYRKATGFEALMGYLYLMNDCERAIALVKLALERIGMKL
ncbi:MAG: ribonuclease III domain-containing protein [Lachnospiraceae bacterium]